MIFKRLTAVSLTLSLASTNLLSCGVPQREVTLSRVQGSRTETLLDRETSSSNTRASENDASRADVELTPTGEKDEDGSDIYECRRCPVERLGVIRARRPNGSEPPKVSLVDRKGDGQGDKGWPKHPFDPRNPSPSDQERDRLKREIQQKKTRNAEDTRRLETKVTSLEGNVRTAPSPARPAPETAGRDHNDDAGNTQKLIENELGGDTPVVKDDGLKTPENTPEGQRIRETRKIIELADKTGNRRKEKLNGPAKEIIKAADSAAGDGDKEAAERLRRDAERLAGLATLPDSALPPETAPLPGKSPGTQTPEQAQGTALGLGTDLLGLSSNLYSLGLGDLSKNVSSVGNTLLDFGLGLSRDLALIDLPLSVLEVAGGVTLAFENGTPVFREATALDIATGCLSLAAAGTAFAAGGWAAVLVGGAFVGTLKVASKSKIGANLGLGISDKAQDLQKIADDLLKELSGRVSWGSTRKIPEPSLNAARHWDKHGREFPNISSAKEYVDAANDFVKNPPSGTLSRTARNGDTVLYNEEKNILAIRDKDSRPTTFYKPDPNFHKYSSNVDFFNNNNF